MPKHTKKHVRITNDDDSYNSYELRNRSIPRQMNIEDNPNGDESGWPEDIMTVRRVRSLHRNTNKNVLNVLPSRKISQFGTFGGRIRGNMDQQDLLDDCNDSESTEHQVQEILNQIEMNNEMMEDTPDGEDRRTKALRDIPQPLTIKRTVKTKLSASVSQKSKNKPISFFKRMKYKWSFWWKRRQQNMRDVSFSMELWYSGIKRIEGHFGSGVATYFRFLRWLFIINLLISLTLLSFVIIPQALYESYYHEISPNVSLNFADIFTGEGYLTNTTLYYGFYSTNVFSIINNQYYNIPASYFFTMFFVYIMFFIAASIAMAKSYGKNYIKTSSGLKNVYANKVFCAWDFSIATEEASSLKKKSFYIEMKELITDYKSAIKLSFKRKLQLFCIRILAHMFVIGFLLGLGFIMWKLIYLQMSVNLAVIISGCMLLVPIIFSYISRFEQYNNPRTTLYITLTRTFAMNVVIVTILFIFWLKSDQKCWETSLGQEVYRLIIFDLLISVLFLPVIEYFQNILNKYLPTQIEIPQFDIARNTLNLIYNQTLMSIGLFFSPLLSVIVVLKMAILFYVRQYTVLLNCKPSTKPWRAAQMQTVFLFMIFISLLVMLLGFGYMFLKVRTGGCGPFQNEDFMYLSLLKGILSLSEKNIFFTFLMYLTKPGVVAVIFIVMSVAAYYLRAKSISEKLMVSQLRELLTLQAKDKQFLLNAITNVTEGVWIYNQKYRTLHPRNNPDISLNQSNMRKPSNSDYQMSPRNYNDSINISSSFRFSKQPSTSGVTRRNYENVEIENFSQ